MLAQTSLPDPNNFSSIGWVIVILFALVGGANQILALVSRVSGKARPTEIADQPVDIRIASEFVRKPDCDVHRGQLERRLEEQDRDRQDLRKMISADREKAEQTARIRTAGIYSKIDEVRKELTTAHGELRHELNRNFQDTERTLGRIEGKLQTVANEHHT